MQSAVSATPTPPVVNPVLRSALKTVSATAILQRKLAELGLSPLSATRDAIKNTYAGNIHSVKINALLRMVRVVRLRIKVPEYHSNNQS